MTVVLLDPMRPMAVPLEAIELLGGPVQLTEEVPVAVRWRMPQVVPRAQVLVSTDPAHPLVQDRIAKGDNVIGHEMFVGDGLVEAAGLMDRMWELGSWEKEQTHATLKPYLLEETYELLDAIDTDDPELVREELGDLLLQVLFHSRIAQEASRFDVDDVAETLIAKLVHRSPHIADDATIDVAAQDAAWQQRKAAEKARNSCLDGIATAQPALAFAEKVITRASRAGLPDELVPNSLRSVSLRKDGSAELWLRTAVVEFAKKVRAAEDAAAADRGAREPLTAADWRAYWR